MKKSISVNKKSRGRPKKKGGVYPVTAVRLSPALGTEVDKWAGSQPDTPTRSEAIRRLVELGLKVKTPARPVSKPGPEVASSGARHKGNRKDYRSRCAAGRASRA